MTTDFQNLKTTYNLINMFYALHCLAREGKGSWDDVDHCADKLRRREPDIDLNGIIADRDELARVRHESVCMTVCDPNTLDDMTDMGDGNYRRMAAYTE